MNTKSVIIITMSFILLAFVPHLQIMQSVIVVILFFCLPKRSRYHFSWSAIILKLSHDIECFKSLISCLLQPARARHTLNSLRLTQMQRRRMNSQNISQANVSSTCKSEMSVIIAKIFTTLASGIIMLVTWYNHVYFQTVLSHINQSCK